METTTTDPAVGERIARVESGLHYPQSLKGETPQARTLTDAMAHFDVPGVSVAVINDYKIEWAKGYGVTDAAHPEPVTPKTLFQAASISKPVTALAVMRLVAAGKLDLDEDVNGYLTSWKVPANGDWQPRVTLRQLLSHSAGLTVHGFPGYAVGRPLPTTVQILDGASPANTPPIRVNAVPGTQFRYSGGGTTVVQLVLTDVLGKPFPDILREWVLDPLGMADSTYEQPLPTDRIAFAASAHWSDRHAVKGRWHVYPEMAAAGLWTTPSDISRFLIGVALARVGKSEILSAGWAAEMLTPQVEPHIGIGLFLEGQGESARFGHSGGNEGFVSDAKMYATRGQGVVIMCSAGYGWAFMPDFERAVASVYDWPDFVPTPPTEITVEAASLEQLAGRYELKPGFDFTVTERGGMLYVQPTGQAKVPLFPSAPTAFFAKALDCEFVFTVGESGRADSLTFKQNGREMTAKRVE